MRRITEIGCRYHCKCGNEWFKAWRKIPWFGDYAMTCERCDRSVWPSSKRDYSRDELSYQEARHDKK